MDDKKNDDNKEGKKIQQPWNPYTFSNLTELPDLGKYWSSSSKVYENIKAIGEWSSGINSNYLKMIDGLASHVEDTTTFPFTYYSNLFGINQNQIQLKGEINKIQKELIETQEKFEKAKASTEESEKLIKRWQELVEELEKKNGLLHISSRICGEASQKLFEDESFRELFVDGKECKTVVVSIDIRRSTELMLKARNPKLFAKFITELSQKMSEVIIGNYGIFDKFTGDGILAFFPDFYSGDDAVGFAIKAAKECHEVFREHYNNSRSCFNVFIKNVGLGIGIDYGVVTLVNNNHSLTVVGVPVVYACRMSGTDAGTTILNQPAIELVEDLYKKDILVQEAEIIIKHEGPAMAYMVELNETIELKKPNWENINNKK